MTTHQTFATTQRGLRRETPAMRLFEKAKRFGVWNPAEIDLQRDAADWQTLTGDEQGILLHLTSLFQAGEEAVTLDLLPLIATIAREGRLEEELYLATFLWEEAKHVDFFDRTLREPLLRLLLLHRYSCLPAQIACPGWAEAPNFPALAARIWP